MIKDVRFNRPGAPLSRLSDSENPSLDCREPLLCLFEAWIESASQIAVLI
jgi:hypothetical protein